MLPAGWGGTSEVLFSIPRRSAVTYSSPDALPAVMRMGDPPGVCEALGRKSPYVAFLHKLNARANRKLFGSLPYSRRGLARLKPPEVLDSLFEELGDAGYPENEVLRALYQALILHDGLQELDARFVQKAEALIGSRAVIDEVLTRFSTLLNQLWAERNSLYQRHGDRYDIPAFLNNQAD